MPRLKQPAASAPRTVLYADNDRLFREAIGDLLKAKGFTVHLAQDGLEALELARRVEPDYLILDVIMPKLSGARVCWLVRQDEKLHHTPIIAFSSLGREDYRWFREMSADAYVAKASMPDACENLILAIEQLDKSPHDPKDGIIGYSGLRSRQLVREILDERAHLLSLLQSLRRGTIELDERGRILLATSDACEILGKKEVHLIGEKFSSFSAPGDRDAVQELIEEVAKADVGQRFHLTLHLGGRDGSVEIMRVATGSDWIGILVLLEPRSSGRTAE